VQWADAGVGPPRLVWHPLGVEEPHRAGVQAPAGGLLAHRGLGAGEVGAGIKQRLQAGQCRRVLVAQAEAGQRSQGAAGATITRRLCTIAGFCRYAVEEELLDHSPAAHVRRARLDCESHAAGLDRNELGALLVAAGLGSAAEHALISLLALNGLRVSEATSADIQNLGIERGHRTLVVTRKGGKVVTIPLAPRTARAIDLTWPSASAQTGQSSWPRTAAGWTGTAPRGSSAGRPAGPGSSSASGRTRCDTHSSPPPWMPGCDVQEAASHADPRTTMRYDRARTSLDRHATYIVAAYVAGAAR
jgi:integrase/recombinase XerD